MRPIETLLLLANLLAFIGLVFPMPSAAYWIRSSVLIALLLGVVQVVIEGPRSQMVPAYLLTGLFFLFWLLQISEWAGRPALLGQDNRLAYGLVVALGVLGLAVSIILPIMIPVFRFPKPSGPYAIGTMTNHWVDDGRSEIFNTEPNARRELMVQIWYPAREDSNTRGAPYLPDADALLNEFVRVQQKSGYKFIFGNLKYITTNATPLAQVTDDEPSYPVLIFLEGTTGFRQMNTFQVEELVSHGYIVVAIDQPYTAAIVVFPDGRQVAMPGIDQIRPLQADPNGILTGRMDLRRIGIFGMSQGGIVGGEACRLEPRLRACQFMDAPMPGSVVQAGLKQPSMWITREADVMRLERQRAGGWSEIEIQAHHQNKEARYMKVKILTFMRWMLILLVAGLIFASEYHAYASATDLKTYPTPGQMIDVGGHRLHIYCLGEGDPTVVLEAGMSGWSTDWTLVQPMVAKATRACTYDRAGYGWSDAGPTPRDSQQVATELHALLSGAEIDGDIILVGHSLGGLFVQYYAKEFPQHIKGLVLVDSVHPEQSLRMKEDARKKYEGNLRTLTSMTRILAPTGSLRLAGQSVTTIADKLPGEYQSMARSLGYQSKAYQALDGEMASFQQSQSQVRDAGPLPNIPMAVISSSLVEDFPPGFAEDSIKSTWDELQADLSKGAAMPQVIAANSGHYIHIDQPKLVIQTVLKMVDMSQGE